MRNAQKIIELAALPAPGRILDAGGGTGRVAKALRPLADQVVVADISLGMLRQAASGNGLSATNCHTENLPFQHESFERVIMVDAFHHVIDQAITAQELWRTVKADGVIVVEEPNIRKLGVKIVALLEKLALMRSYFLSPAKIAALFKFPGAQVRIVEDGYIAWIVVKKSANL